MTPPLQAILSQLVRKALEGNARAVRVLERYKQLAAQGAARAVTLEFVDNEPLGRAAGENGV